MLYIQPGHEKDLRDFKYRGINQSISYEHLWGPFAEWLLKMIPTTIAPNLITLIAFIIILIGHFSFILPYPYTSPPQSWQYLIVAATLFIYQHLDNLDGKQARRTGNSSPIGMLFDHGCDAISSLLLGLQVLRMIQCQDSQLAIYSISFIVAIPNFLMIWTQYGVGHFKLGVINPVDDGLPFIQLMGIGGAMVSFSFFKEDHWISTYNVQMLIIFAFFAMAVSWQASKDTMKDSKRTKADLQAALVLPFILVSTFILIRVAGLSSQIYGEQFLLFYYIFTCFWGRNEILMQISAVANQKYHTFNSGTIIFLSGLLGMVILPSFGVDLRTYLWVFLIVQLISLLELIYGFLIQAADILNIRIFHINPPPKTQQTITQSYQKVPQQSKSEDEPKLS